MRITDAVIIGAGQAGLAMSHGLTARGIEHVVLERGRVAERWRSERWDSFRLLTGRGLNPEAQGQSWLTTIYRQAIRGKWL